MTFYKVLPLVLGAALGALIETGARASSACACSCDDWVAYVPMEVEGPARALDQWLNSVPSIYLRVAGKHVATDVDEPGGAYRLYPHASTNKDGVE